MVAGDSAMETTHRFLDEAGDTTFYGVGRQNIVGTAGVSRAFGIGSVKFPDIADARARVVAATRQIEMDPLFNTIPSVAKRIASGGSYFHATDDPPDVRTPFYQLLRALDCRLEVVVGRKVPDLFLRKHHDREAEFYADVLGHLIKNKLQLGQRLVLNISQRGSTTKNATLELARQKAAERFCKTHPPGAITTSVVFNVQTPRTEPLLCVADYMCWAVQRVFERGETRYYDLLRDQIRLVVDLYDVANYAGSGNYYKPDHPLTSRNKLGPPSP